MEHHNNVDEMLQIENWNLIQFEKLGLGVYEAVKAIDEKIDYHEVERLVKNGCPAETALEIVR